MTRPTVRPNILLVVLGLAVLAASNSAFASCIAERTIDAQRARFAAQAQTAAGRAAQVEVRFENRLARRLSRLEARTQRITERSVAAEQLAAAWGLTVVQTQVEPRD